MPPLYEQRSVLCLENTDLILEWLALLEPSGRKNLIYSMVRRFSLPELKDMNAWVKQQIAEAKALPPTR